MLVVFAVFLAVIGVSLLIGETILGSIGWGVLHGVELFISLAIAAVLLALGVSPRRIVGALAVGIVVGVVVGVVLGLNLLNQAYTAIGDQTGLAVADGHPSARRRDARSVRPSDSSLGIVARSG